MSKRMWLIFTVVLVVSVSGSVIFELTFKQSKPTPEIIIEEQIPILTFPARKSQDWVDPEAGKQWEDGQRLRAIKLVNHEKLGPFVCVLRFLPETANNEHPEIEITLQSTNDKAIVVAIEHDLSDQFTFVLFDSENKPVSSFNPATLRSDWPKKNSATLEAGKLERFTFPVGFLEIMLCSGFPPGTYSLQAVFTNNTIFGLQEREEGAVFARSNRIPLRIK